MQENGSVINTESVPFRLAGLPWRLALLFFGVVPLVVGLNQGWLQAGLGRYFARPQSMLLWCGNWLLYWWVCEVMTRVAAAVLRPWALRPIVTLLLGALLATMLSPLYFGAYSLLFLDYLPSGAWVSEADDMHRIFEGTFLFRLLASGSGGILLWTLSNFFVDIYLGGARFRALGLAAARQARDAPAAPVTGDALPAARPPSPKVVMPALFLRLTKLPKPSPQSLIAVEAQEHYLKVHTDLGSELIYYRFGDAVRELQDWNGLQVHRSFWISRAAVMHVENRERRLRLIMRNSLQVPVGTSFLALVRQAGLAQDWHS